MSTLKRKLPPNRSFDQVYNHYLVEKELAEKLRLSSQNERTQIYLSMYDTLFRRVPDHPRITRSGNRELTDFANNSKLSLTRRYIGSHSTVLEFAPGDCKFAMLLCQYARFVYAVDISDQRNVLERDPENFQLIIYDGYQLEVPENSIDVIFSDQLIEHFHPDDSSLHFQLTWRLLAPGGIYIFRTPHAFSGPHDISKFFSDTPEGFHLKEWTYGELTSLLQTLGFRKIRGYWAVRHFRLRLPLVCFRWAENLFREFPARPKHYLSQWLFRNINMTAVKPSK